MQRFVLVGPSGHMHSPRGMDQYNTAYYQRAADSLLQVAQQILNARQDILNVIATMEEEQSLKEAAENKKTHNEGILTHSGDDAAASIKTAPRNSVPSSSDEPKKYNKRIWTLFSHPIKKESCDDEIDTPDKAKWSCDRCGKTFNNRSILKKHHFIHTGEQPYKCDSCNKSFNRRDNMNRHRRVCNKPTVDYSKLFHDQLPIEPSTTPVSSPFPTIHQIMARILSPISSPESIDTPSVSPQ